MSPPKRLAIALVALPACAVLLPVLPHSASAPAAATIEDGAGIATLDDVAAPAARPAQPAASIEDGGRIATLDDVYPARLPVAAGKRSALPHPATAPRPPAAPPRGAVRAAESVAQALPEPPQVIRRVPPPVVTLDPGAGGPAGPRLAPGPLVTLPAGRS
jgi:hypothetical protein